MKNKIIKLTDTLEIDSFTTSLSLLLLLFFFFFMWSRWWLSRSKYPNRGCWFSSSSSICISLSTSSDRFQRTAGPVSKEPLGRVNRSGPIPWNRWSGWTSPRFFGPVLAVFFGDFTVLRFGSIRLIPRTVSVPSLMPPNGQVQMHTIFIPK